MLSQLRNVNSFTRLQILVDVAQNQPDVQQRDIARRLGMSPQGMSDYVKELVAEGWLESEGRSKYRVTKEGVDWVLGVLREWQSYADMVQKTIASMAVTAAVADSRIRRGQKVGLEMRDGMLRAVVGRDAEAKATAVSDADEGEDVGVSNIEGILPMRMGRMTVIRVPAIRKGGSRKVDLEKLRHSVEGRQVVGAIGIEALVSLRKAGIEADCFYGVKETAVEAQRSGLSVAVACVDDSSSELLRALEASGVEHEILDAAKA